MKPSTDSWKYPHDHKSSPPSSTTLVSSGKTTQLGTQFRRVLESTGDQFLIQVVEEPAWRGVVLHLVLMKKGGLVQDVKVGAALAAVTMT